MPIRSVFAAMLCISAIAPATAFGDTFCVNVASTCAPANNKATIEAAVTAAKATGTDDVIEVGTGTYTSAAATGFAIDGNGHAIELRGRRRGGITTLTAPASIAVSDSVVNVTDDDATVTDVTIRIPASPNFAVYGATVYGTLRRVRVTAAATDQYRYGVNVYGLAEDIDVDFSTVSDTTAGIGATASDDDALIRDVHVTANYMGLSAQSGGTIERARVEGPVGARLLQDSHIADSVMQLTAAGSTGVQSFNQPNQGTQGTLSGVTIEGAGKLNVVGVSVTDPNAGASTAVALDGVVFSRVAKPISVHHSSGTGASATVTRSCLDAAANQATGGGTITLGAGVISPCAPGLRDPSGDDLRPRADSVLLDTGDPTAPPAGALDAAGAERALDGDGDGTARRDIGGLEFVPKAPLVSAAGPASGAAGESLAFTATTSDPDPGDTVTVTWAFDDGATATGPSASHAFATPGPHIATATARDRSGRTATATATVQVDAVPSGPPGPGGGGGPVALPVDRIAPVLTKVSLAKRFRRAGRLRLTSSEPAKLVLRLQRRKGKRWRAVKGSRTAAVKQGSNRLRFRPAAKRPGSYRLVLVATDAAGNRSATKRVTFRLRR